MHRSENAQYRISSRMICPSNPFSEFNKREIEQSIVERFEQQVAKYSTRLAIKDGKERITYADFNQSANRIARAIIERRGQGSEPVGLYLDQGAMLISAIFGVLKAGKVYVAMDTSFPHSKCVSMIKHSRAGLVITDRTHYEEAAKFAADSAQLMIIEEIEASSLENLNLPISPETIAYIIYTSGSTGRPKGVFQTHKNVLHNVMRCSNMLHVGEADRLSLLWSCSFAASVPNVFGALLNGAALYPYDVKKDGTDKIASWLKSEEITIYHSVPTLYRHFLSSHHRKGDFPKLRLIKLSGETVYKSDVKLYRKHFHKECIFHVSLASTETNIIRQFFCDHQTPVNDETVPAGFEVEDMEVMIIDDKGREAGANCEGEIAVRSRYLPQSYYNADPAESSPFLRDKDDANTIIYRTGDLGYMLPDGCLVHCGRKDMQVKIRGYRVEIREVENALNRLEGVKEALADGRKDPDGIMQLVAYVVPYNGQAIKAGELRNSLKNVLPGYMVPSRFVFMDELPLTLSGKLDRRALPDPDYTRSGSEENYVPPRTHAEMLLAVIWRKLLKVKQVGVFDNFFELGGHSLLVASLSATIRKKTGKSLPPAVILQSPTIRQLAKIIEGDHSQIQISSVNIQPGNSGPPFFWIGINTYRPPYLGSERPVHAIILQGDYGKPIRFKTVEDLAAHHLEEIKNIQPKGPYLLGGYCFSGLVAFEMARQLFREGEEVSMLCLIDPLPFCLPSNNKKCEKDPLVSTLKSKTESLRRKVVFLGDIERSASILGFLLRKINFLMLQKLISLGFSVPHYYRDLYRMQSAARYTTPDLYPGRAVIFLRENRRHDDWIGFGGNGTHIYEVAGTSHHTMMDEPYVGTWTGQLSRYLDEIHEQNLASKRQDDVPAAVSANKRTADLDMSEAQS